jgi:chorismate mutase
VAVKAAPRLGHRIASAPEDERRTYERRHQRAGPSERHVTRVVGIRGATTVDKDTAEEVLGACRELLEEVLSANALDAADLVSILFTVTPDIHSAYPAAAARDLGLTNVALLGAQEIHAEEGMPRVLRVLVHAYSDIPARHVYLRDARTLREDLAEGSDG